MHTRPAAPLLPRAHSFGRPVVVATLAVAAVALAGCATRGNGEPAVEDRTVESFHGVDVGGVFTLEATEGSPALVQLAGDANLLALVETRVEDGILRVRTRESISPKLALVLRVRTPELREIDVSGAADASITTSQPKLELDVRGASDVVVRGTTQSFDLEVDGASDVDATQLRADAVVVDASGASEAHVTAIVSLDAEASGASEITYAGGASVNRDASGASEIVARRDEPAPGPETRPKRP